MPPNRFLHRTALPSPHPRSHPHSLAPPPHLPPPAAQIRCRGRRASHRRRSPSPSRAHALPPVQIPLDPPPPRSAIRTSSSRPVHELAILPSLRPRVRGSSRRPVPELAILPPLRPREKQQQQMEPVAAMAPGELDAVLEAATEFTSYPGMHGDGIVRQFLEQFPLPKLFGGDPTMYEAFWREAGERATVVIPGWRGISYFSDSGSLCWFLEPEFEREVRRLHRLVGNAAVDGYHLVVGTGATQLFQAAMYALSPAGADRPVGVVSPAPYYSAYPPQTDLLLSGYYRWAGDANAFDGDSHIELVCSPNNPDGAIREAVLSSESGKAIHDLVYYWPQYTPITRTAAHDIMLFTVSKTTGHAGTRLGWALVKDPEVARKMVYFVDRSTIGVSKDSQLRAAKILGVVSDAYDDDDGSTTAAATTRRLRLFDFARRRMADRWRALRAAVATSGTFSLPEETTGYCNFTKETVAAHPAFAWLRCEKEGVEDCAELLRGHRIVVRGGEQFGGDGRCVRVNMLDRDTVFEILIQRLSSI